MGYSRWGHKESDMTKWLTHTHTHTHTVCLISHRAKKKKGIFPLFHVSTPYTSWGAGSSLQIGTYDIDVYLLEGKERWNLGLEVVFLSKPLPSFYFCPTLPTMADYQYLSFPLWGTQLDWFPSYSICVRPCDWFLPMGSLSQRRNMSLRVTEH